MQYIMSSPEVGTHPYLFLPQTHLHCTSQTFSKVPQSFHDRLDATLPIRRTAIPPKPNVSFNLWSFVKNSVGKDLTKLPMPVSLTLLL